MAVRNPLDEHGVFLYIMSVADLQGKPIQVGRNGTVVITEPLGRCGPYRDTELTTQFNKFSTPFTNLVWNNYEAVYGVIYGETKEVHIWTRSSNADQTIRLVTEYVKAHLTV
jgi:hypothetical protein